MIKSYQPPLAGDTKLGARNLSLRIPKIPRMPRMPQIPRIPMVEVEVGVEVELGRVAT